MQFAAAQTLDDLLEAGEERIMQAQAGQDEIDAIVEQTEDLFQEYQQILRENENLQIYNNLVQAQVDVQLNTLDRLRASIDEVGVVERQILPLMRRMINGLERFIDLDLPFFLDRRHAQVDRLRGLLSRADVTVASKFNNVLTAWLEEMDDYGRNGDTYTDEITTADGRTRQVEILRIGRIALLYVTPNGSEAGRWNNTTRRWETLDPSFIPDIQIGIESYKSGQPALFLAPVAAPEEN
jgi:hypothetical protein